MKKTAVLFGTAALVLTLGACGGEDSSENSQGSVNDGEQTNEYGSIDHGVKDKGTEMEGKDGGDVGFSLNGGDIEEASGVPEDQKEAIEKAFSEYIDTLNAGDVDAYLATLSEEGYDLGEERAATEELLTENELTRTPEDLTIVEYTEDEAQVFTVMKTAVKSKASGEEDVSSGRQVTVMNHEDGNWKVKSVHYIGDLEKEK
ncbi:MULTISPECIES: nuclear transport factor 2 family protein [Sporosarcina]|uniref:nuclear transport factor 2 family protein n=1 Tax=Sporosarcina TaxID=1569 RepID=UPI000693D313|nr:MULTISPECIES: nuclear transport factor 2 family protein [Sporosarcina]WJY26158.1 DUF3225 domain-containing protein [Sporosarcina sp. 0.2-SM1T-5]